MTDETTLREPAKAETRLGWWFMRKFRGREVQRRTARNEVMLAAYLRTVNPYDADSHVRLVNAINNYCSAMDEPVV